MSGRPLLPPLALLAALAPVCCVPGAAAPDSGPVQGILISTALSNLALAAAIVFLFIFGLYAYAGLARFAPYHSWIYLYLVSLTGAVWALFLYESGGALSDTVFLLTTVIGINLIVHIFRFDRAEIAIPGRGKSSGNPLR